MNELINIAQILKNVSYEGDKLFSSVGGECKLKEVSLLDGYIKIEFVSTGNTCTFDIYGKFLESGKCLLFPTEKVEDWGCFRVYYANITDPTADYMKKAYKVLTDLGGKGTLDDIIDGLICYIDRITKEIKHCYPNSPMGKYILSTGTPAIISTYKTVDFKPYDKVLVRDSNSDVWKIDFFNSYHKDALYPYVTLSSAYMQCIPYNSYTSDLIDTTKNTK